VSGLEDGERIQAATKKNKRRDKAVWFTLSARLLSEEEGVQEVRRRGQELTVLGDKDGDRRAGHASPCLGAGGHLHAVGGVEFQQSHIGRGGVAVSLT
jgi:hypothetical protein